MNQLKANTDAAKGGDMPWMAKTELGEWVEMEVDVRTIEPHNDSGPPKDGNDHSGWSCYRFQAHRSGALTIDYTECPFWAMDEFMEACLETVKESGWAKFEYQRTADRKGLNVAEFQWD